MKRKLKDKMTYRTFQIRISDGKPDSLDEENRSVEITVASEQPVPVFDFERFEIVNEILLMSGAELP